MHQRVTIEKEGRFAKFADKYKAISPTGKKISFTEEAWREADKTQFKLIERPGDFQSFIMDFNGNPITNQSFTRGRQRSIPNLGKNVNPEIWGNINVKFKSASTQEAGQKKIAAAEKEEAKLA